MARALYVGSFTMTAKRIEVTSVGSAVGCAAIMSLVLAMQHAWGRDLGPSGQK